MQQIGDDVALAKGKLNYLTVMGLEDLYKQINLLETLRAVFGLCVQVKK